MGEPSPRWRVRPPPNMMNPEQPARGSAGLAMVGLVLVLSSWLRRSPPTSTRPRRRNPPPEDATVSERRMVWRAQKAAQRANRCPPALQAHHPNYTRPLDVECLSPIEHKTLHEKIGRDWRRFRPGARASGVPPATPRRRSTPRGTDTELPWR